MFFIFFFFGLDDKQKVREKNSLFNVNLWKNKNIVSNMLHSILFFHKLTTQNNNSKKQKKHFFKWLTIDFYESYKNWSRIN